MGNLNKSYQWAIDTCNAPNVGYSQGYRNQQEVNGITYYDCSSFIWYALKNGGFDNIGTSPFTTRSMESYLLSAGFTEKPITSDWKNGDIVWRNGHTEMVYQGGIASGITMGAHSSNVPLADQVSIKTSVSSSANWTKLYRYGEGGASKYGASIYVISAICGNLWQESTLNPALWEGQTEGTWTQLNKGYGLGQWTNTGGDTHGRLYQLHEYLVNNGYSITDGNAQLEYIIEENTWYPNASYPEFNTLSDFLSSTSTDIEYLTHAWNRCWEGIHDSSWDIRVEYANNCYNFIQENANNTDISDWIYSDKYLPNASRLNNAVMVYRYFSSGGGGGGKPTPRPPHTVYGRRKMPIWLMVRKMH